MMTASYGNSDPAYSPSHVIKDQNAMLLTHLSAVLRSDVESRYINLPVAKKQIERALSCLGSSGVVFVHDWIFHNRFQWLGDILAEISPEFPNLRFYHWIHSIPVVQKAWWDLNQYGDNHWIVYPYECDRAAVAAKFRTTIDRVIAIPHIVDIRTLHEFSLDLWKITTAAPGLLSAQYVQVYPVAADRLKDKGLDKLIKTFAAIKSRGKTVCLLVVDSWTGRRPREDKQTYYDLAQACGLEGAEFSFVSDIVDNFRAFSRADVAKLMQLNSIFCFPTMGEAFGLVLYEALVSSAVTPVVNADLDATRTIPIPGLTGHFGSCERRLRFDSGETAHYEQIAANIIGWTEHNFAIQSRNYVRQTLNMDAIFRRYYEPLLRGEHG